MTIFISFPLSFNSKYIWFSGFFLTHGFLKIAMISQYLVTFQILFFSASNFQLNTISVKRSTLYFWNLSKFVEMCLIAQSTLCLCKHMHCKYLEGNRVGSIRLTSSCLLGWESATASLSLIVLCFLTVLTTKGVLNSLRMQVALSTVPCSSTRLP